MHAAAGAHSLGTGIQHFLGPLVHADTDCALTMTPWSLQMPFPTFTNVEAIQFFLRGDLYSVCLDSNLEFLLSAAIDSKGALVIRLCGRWCPDVTIS